ncbi:hypothetical protein LTR84_012774 [Exophiala bonariae]|uniref:Extracellular membrane protein CFEM domain-containing protein n=1 Tax=Exophiala bonariae TaxID=1690606 RepID=A0AAV9NF49_9EURO|nr:hypothetical protein LTR84_012774 [Exophiala bonariae]
MLSTITALLPLFLSTSLFSNIVQAQTENGACVTACFSSNPKSSFCDGDEQGTALDQCRCASYSLTGDPQIECIKLCPEDQQLIFANQLPDLCNALLFPNLDLSAPSSATAENTASAASSPTAAPTGSTTSGSGAASATSSAASGTASATGSAGSDATRDLPHGLFWSLAGALGVLAWL